MPLQEKKVFIRDPRRAMTTEEKNRHLSAKLAGAPHAKRKIVRIEISASGWYVYYHAGSTG
jgi:hypothetical protein